MTPTALTFPLLFHAFQYLSKDCLVQVSVPLRRINRANQRENVQRPSQKYMEIITIDNFYFWFTGFLSYERTFSYLQQAISQAQRVRTHSKTVNGVFFFLHFCFIICTLNSQNFVQIFVVEKLISNVSTAVPSSRTAIFLTQKGKKKSIKRMI